MSTRKPVYRNHEVWTSESQPGKKVFHSQGRFFITWEKGMSPGWLVNQKSAGQRHLHKSSISRTVKKGRVSNNLKLPIMSSFFDFMLWCCLHPQGVPVWGVKAWRRSPSRLETKDEWLSGSATESPEGKNNITWYTLKKRDLPIFDQPIQHTEFAASSKILLQDLLTLSKLSEISNMCSHPFFQTWFHPAEEPFLYIKNMGWRWTPLRKTTGLCPRPNRCF